MSLLNEKTALRKLYTEKRKAVENKTQADERILQKLIETNEFIESDCVFTYVSVRTEVDTIKLIEKCFLMNKKVAVPICGKKGIMNFHYIKSFDELCNSKFGIPEPDVNSEIAVATEKSLCIVPGLSFDKNGFRLGYGGGYYDRYLVSFKGEVVGLCYDECLTDVLPRDEFDINIPIVITENNIT